MNEFAAQHGMLGREKMDTLMAGLNENADENQQLVCAAVLALNLTQPISFNALTGWCSPETWCTHARERRGCWLTWVPQPCGNGLEVWRRVDANSGRWGQGRWAPVESFCRLTVHLPSFIINPLHPMAPCLPKPQMPASVLGDRLNIGLLGSEPPTHQHLEGWRVPSQATLRVQANTRVKRVRPHMAACEACECGGRLEVSVWGQRGGGVGGGWQTAGDGWREPLVRHLSGVGRRFVRVLLPGSTNTLDAPTIQRRQGGGSREGAETLGPGNQKRWRCDSHRPPLPSPWEA